jgi:hypothetical protein
MIAGASSSHQPEKTEQRRKFTLSQGSFTSSSDGTDIVSAGSPLPNTLEEFMLRVLIALVMLTGPASAFAQDVFTPQDSGLKVGQKVRILLDGACAGAPCQAEVVKGKIAELSTTSLVVDAGRSRHELDATRIQFVERSKDGIWNGVLVGFVVGFSVGFVAVLSDGCDPGQWCLFDGPSFAAGFGLLTGGIGAGIGAVTDAAISNHRVVFARTTFGAVASTTAGAPSRAVGFRVRF